MTHCTHAKIKTLSTRCFSGPVCGDENRAAHGGITELVECVSCGARAARNVNCHHVEHGPWGVTREERRQVAVEAAELADAEYARARGLSETIDGLTLAIDPDGYLLLSGRSHTEAEATAIAASWHGVEAARRLRLARDQATEAESDV